jgi:hypothetical protein
MVLVGGAEGDGGAGYKAGGFAGKRCVGVHIRIRRTFPKNRPRPVRVGGDPSPALERVGNLNDGGEDKLVVFGWLRPAAFVHQPCGVRWLIGQHVEAGHPRHRVCNGPEPSTEFPLNDEYARLYLRARFAKPCQALWLVAGSRPTLPPGSCGVGRLLRSFPATLSRIAGRAW